MKAAIITVNFHSAGGIHRLEQVVAQVPDVRLIVVDNSGEFIAKNDATSIIQPPKNLGFGCACNLGAEAGVDEILGFINPDIEIDPLQLKTLAGAPCANPGVWGPRTVDVSGRSSAIVHRYGLIPMRRIGFEVGSSDLPVSIYVSGACMFTSRELFQKLRGFSRDTFMYGEDLDFCLRAAAFGAAISIQEDTVICHKSGTSSSKREFPYRRLWISFRGHYGVFKKRYNPIRAVALSAYLASGRRDEIR
jgi:N-acetylglucosaminyl-diphospho-decaprenol L-rhamnosyltransferase